MSVQTRDDPASSTLAETKPTLRDRWVATRNGLLAKPHFQRWASTFAPTRSIARQRAGALFDLCAGFVYSQILFACVEIKLFEALAAGPVSVDALASRCGFKPDAMARLLQAAAALHLVEKVGMAKTAGEKTYRLGVHGAAYLGNPAIGAMIAHHAMLYRDLADPLAIFKGEKTDTELAKFWPYAEGDTPGSLAPDAVAPYSALMSSSQALIADDVLDAYPFVDHGCIMDIGGGGGDFLVAAAKRRPDLHLILFDLPAVASRAEALFTSERLAGRAKAIGGDFKRGPLPQGADLMALVRVAHDLDDGDLDALLAKIFAALPPGGILLLAEPLADTAGAQKVGAYFEVYLLAMQHGRPRSGEELRDRLYAAGFARARVAPTARPMLTGLIVAQKSAGPRNRAVRRD